MDPGDGVYNAGDLEGEQIDDVDLVGAEVGDEKSVPGGVDVLVVEARCRTRQANVAHVREGQVGFPGVGRTGGQNETQRHDDAGEDDRRTVHTQEPQSMQV